MLRGAQLLTISTPIPDYKPKESPSTARLLVAPSFLLLQVRTSSPLSDAVPEPMAHHQHRNSRTQNENELWFSMSSSARPQQEQSRPEEPSAYRATSNRLSIYSTSSRSPPRIPTISTSTDLNKPLPSSPSDSEKRKRKSASLRALLRRQQSNHFDPNHLHPEAYPPRNSSLTLDTNSLPGHSYSRSMPNSPYEYIPASSSSDPANIPRASSAAANYPDQTEYQPYSLPPQEPQQTTNPVRAQRSISMNTYFESTTPPRARTFPESTALSPSASTTRENVSNRPRPHTWLSPTEPFTDVSQFHLFAEALTGLPDDSDSLSPNAPVQLQGSLFARRTHNDIIPLPMQYSMAPPSQASRRTDWQNFEPPSFTMRSTSTPATNFAQTEPYQHWQPPPHMAAVNMELEMLGLNDEHGPDDELPDYAQSQAEMNARRREESSARARELEARWRGARRD